MTFAILQLGALLLAGPPAVAHPPGDELHFAPPVLLKGGAKPLGRGLLYPSPALFDVDGDGAVELVMGDLMGSLHVAERLPGEDPLAWSEPRRLEAADGEELDFSNW